MAAFGQIWVAQTSGTTASLRGVSPANARVVWASGSGGTWLRTLDGGATWKAAVVSGAEDLDFRGIRAFDDKMAWLLSSGPGAKSRIYKTEDGGAHWALVYTNPDAAGFYDAVAFWDARRGVVLGDPVDGQFVILLTNDGGQTWKRRKLPPSLPNEGAFAASNSSLALRGSSEIWFGTGGPSGARVFHSTDSGEHWDVANTPLRHDGAGAGIFSLAFADGSRGVVVGGDYGKPADAAANIAITEDGSHWTEPSGNHPGGYRSAVAYLPGSQLWLATGTSGSDWSHDGGHNWVRLDNSAFNALAVAGNQAWAVGPSGRIAKLRLP